MWIFKDYRLMNVDEHKKILEIRNSEFVRSSSSDNKFITFEEHLKWVRNMDKNRCYMALFVKGNIEGGVNFTFYGKTVKNWGIFFSKTTMPLVSVGAVYLFIDYMFDRFDVLNSEVLKVNKRALEFNRYFGVEVVDENEKFYKMKLTKEKWENIKKNPDIYKRVQKIKYKFLCKGI